MFDHDAVPNRMPRVLTPALVILALLATPGSFAQNSPTPVIAARVQQTEVIEEVPLTGTVVSSQRARLSTEISGLAAAIEVDIGDKVATGDVMLRLKSDLEQLALEAKRAEAEQARRELADARRRLADAERLGRTNTVSVNEINSLKAEVSIDSAVVARLQAEEKRQQLRLDQHVLRAPFAGVISSRQVEKGEWVEPGESVMELVTLDAPEIEFQVPQWVYQRLDDVSRIKVRFDALPNQEFESAIIAVVPVTDRNSRTFLIRARLGVANARLIPGISASALMHIRDAHSGAVIDRNALIRYPDGRVTVWVVEDNDGRATVSERRVTTGLSFDGRISISSGVEAGETIVVNGNESLREGQAVTVKQLID